MPSHVGIETAREKRTHALAEMGRDLKNNQSARVLTNTPGFILFVPEIMSGYDFCRFNTYLTHKPVFYQVVLSNLIEQNCSMS